MKMQLALDDLIEKCPVCKGTGKKKVKLETDDDVTDCDACDGYGRAKVTENGKALLDFIRIVTKRGAI